MGSIRQIFLAAPFYVFFVAHGVGFAEALETVPADEPAAIQTIVSIVRDDVVKKQAARGGIYRRDAHPKAHGCVQAEFAVNAALPESLRSGVFQDGKKYPTWIRFSNSSGIQPDATPDGRGMAIKLMGVPGDKILDEQKTATTQDFVLLNHPVFFIRNARDYVEFSKASAAGEPKNFFMPGWNPLNWKTHEYGVVKGIRGHLVSDLLDTAFFSGTPYLYKNRAAKFMARPCSGERVSTKLPASPNFLREALDDRLLSSQGCFDFYVQFQKDAVRTPVEDPTIEWTRFDAPYYRVARLTIPAQRFLSDAQINYCENLSFSPWHALPDHRPLGGINRLRKSVYQTVSEFRHEMNRVQLVEPTGF